jgi:hypothetical protein
LLDAFERLRQAKLGSSQTAHKVAAGLARLYDQTGGRDDADRWRAESARLTSATQSATTQPAATASSPPPPTP